MAVTQKRKWKDTEPKDDMSPVSAAARSSILNPSEVVFPRGGGSVLTPLERKEISNRVTADVLFEKETTKESSSKSTDATKKRKTTATTVINPAPTVSGTIYDQKDDSNTTTTSMTLKNLIPGSVVLGQVISIQKLGMQLGLPGNIRGYVPITSVSKQITQQLEALEQDSDDEDASSSPQLSEKVFPELSKIFQLGQWLRAVVLEESSVPSEHKHKIQLSVEPEKVNAHLEDDDLVPGGVLQVAVNSVQDHGCIVDTGKKVPGFIFSKSFKNSGIDMETDLKPGFVLLATISKLNNKNTITLTLPSMNNKDNGSTLSTATSVDAILPGVMVNAHILDITEEGIFCRVLGLLPGRIPLAHLKLFNVPEIREKYKIGSTIKSRVVGVLEYEGSKSLTLSTIPSILELDSTYDESPLESFPFGFTFESVKIVGKDSNYVYLELNEDTYGQVHLSKLNKEVSIDSFYKVGSTHHKARVIGYSPVDKVFVLTMDPHQLEAKFLNIQDIPIGEIVTGVVTKVHSHGLNIKIFDQFEAQVPYGHMSDVMLTYPEMKFKIGTKVKGRVLKFYRGSLCVTLKKSLLRSERDELIFTYEDVVPNKRTFATVEKFFPTGVLMSFFNNISGFLPKTEISEAYVNRPEDHLKLFQTISVRVDSIDPATNKFRVSCLLSKDLSEEQEKKISTFIPGSSILEVYIVEKMKDALIVEVKDSNVRGVIQEGQLSDGDQNQNKTLLRTAVVGSSLEALFLQRDPKSRTINFTAKDSLIRASKSGQLPASFEELPAVGEIIYGYVHTITNAGLFIEFADGLSGFARTKDITDEPSDKLPSLYFKNQSVRARILKLDDEFRKFRLTLKDIDHQIVAATNPVDKSITNLNEFVPGKITKAIIKSVTATQFTVELAENQLGRIDVSQVFDSLLEIKDTKKPLSSFKEGAELKVKVIGYQNRDSSFTSVAFRDWGDILVELSIKKSELEEEGKVNVLSLTQITPGTKWLGFVTRYARGFWWVSVSPKFRTKLSLMDLSKSGSVEELEKAYPLGSAIEVTAKQIIGNKAVEVFSKENRIETINDVKVGDKLPCRIISLSHDYVTVELSDKVKAKSFITEALDDYSESLESAFSTNDICTATVLSVDDTTRQISVSLRSENAKDKLIESFEDVKRGDIVRGFITRISNFGVYVSLGRTVFALVRVTDISDLFLTDWKKHVKLNQFVTGKIVDAGEERRILMTLKESQVGQGTGALHQFDDLKIGDVYEGTIKKIMDFGVFITLDGVHSVDGLCHRSQISDSKIENFESLFNQGDRVKVKILDINRNKKQLSLGMKASYFANRDDEEEADQLRAETDDSVDSDSDDQMMENIFETRQQDSDDEPDVDVDTESPKKIASGLSTNGFDWTASILDQAEDEESSSSDEEDFTKKKDKKNRKTKASIAEDKSATLNTRTPQSVSDFERLLIGNPDSSILWMNYMSFQLQLSEIEKAREIAERALKIINYREEQEKMNIWIALLNLENTFGTDDTLEEVFKRACQYMDSYVMHQKLVGIFALSEKWEKCEEIYTVMTKKFGRNVTTWVSYGAFLLERGNPEEARQVLGRALKVLPKADHIEVVRKFAQLEFAHGDAEQGRSLFEGLLADVPKRIDLWNVYIDQEIKINEKKKVEDLFERVITKKLTRKQARFFFGKWLEFEEKQKDVKAADYVKAQASDYVQKHQK
ncbi:hypothetical protein LJB42_004739 [Komagataella kurtzmanii]|nr:hypothetical protein LJB42_004739 [Komagataella kurtzmanii]